MTTYLGAVVSPDFISTKVAAKAIWQFITCYIIEAGNKVNVIAARWALNSGDKDIVMDMRAMNVKTKDHAFVPFWLGGTENANGIV